MPVRHHIGQASPNTHTENYIHFSDISLRIAYLHHNRRIHNCSTASRPSRTTTYVQSNPNYLIGLKVTLTVTCCGISIQQFWNFKVTGIVNGAVSSSC